MTPGEECWLETKIGDRTVIAAEKALQEAGKITFIREQVCMFCNPPRNMQFSSKLRSRFAKHLWERHEGIARSEARKIWSEVEGLRKRAVVEIPEVDLTNVDDHGNSKGVKVTSSLKSVDLRQVKIEVPDDDEDVDDVEPLEFLASEDVVENHEALEPDRETVKTEGIEIKQEPEDEPS